MWGVPAWPLLLPPTGTLRGPGGGAHSRGTGHGAAVLGRGSGTVAGGCEISLRATKPHYSWPSTAYGHGLQTDPDTGTYIYSSKLHEDRRDLIIQASHMTTSLRTALPELKTFWLDKVVWHLFINLEIPPMKISTSKKTWNDLFAFP